MNKMTRRIGALAVGVALVSSMGACGIIGGSTIDCASIKDEMEDVANNLQGDTPQFEESVATLRDSASDISDSELQTAVNEFADLTEDIHQALKDMETDPTSVDPDQLDTAKAEELQKTFEDKCSAL